MTSFISSSVHVCVYTSPYHVHQRYEKADVGNHSPRGSRHLTTMRKAVLQSTRAIVLEPRVIIMMRYLDTLGYRARQALSRLHSC